MPHVFLRRLAPLAAALALAAPASAQLTRVTAGLGGVPPNGVNGAGVLSANGRFVAFESEASNLVTGDTNDSIDVFVRDLLTATTTRVSVAQDGLQRTGHSGVIFDIGGDGQLDISDDGRYVVFMSRAPLAAGDAVQCEYLGEFLNCPDIYLRDRVGGSTTRVSIAPGGAEPDGASHDPKVSGDGRWIVFESEATNLVPGDTNGVTDVFLFDRESGTLTRVSVASGGLQVDLPSFAPTISDDGNILAFVSASTSLGADPDTVSCERGPPACLRPFVVDRQAGTTRRIPAPPIVTSSVVPTPFGPLAITYRVEAAQALVAPDGASIAVNASSIASDITDSTGFGSVSWVYDRALARVTRRDSGESWASWDGRRLAYSRFVEGDVISGTIGVRDIAGGLEDPIATVSGIAIAFPGNMSADGRHVVFQTTAVIADDVDGLADLYVLDRDGDADGMATTWETLFGLDPSSGADAAADPDGDGATNLAEFQRGSHPRGVHRRFLAEGTTNAFFQTQVGIANPGPTTATVVTRFLGDNGRTWSGSFTIPARQSRSLAADGVFAASFSAVIESDQPVVADRVMTWGGGYGSHSETAIAAPSTTWFLAEGATHGSFQLFYLLQNPAATPAQVDVTYLRPTPAPPITVSYLVASESRLTIPIDAIPGLAATDVSARIVSNVPILVERAMYMDTPSTGQVFGAGHAGSGVTAANPRWFLAEGATGAFFDMYYLIANPSTQATNVRITYLLPSGEAFAKQYLVAAQSRLTISVDGEDARLTNTPVSAIVESLDGVRIAVERSMWWPGEGQWYEGHLSAGSTRTARRWAVAGGVVDAGVETFVLVANTSNVAGNVTLTVLRSHDGPAPARTIALRANSRVTVPMSQVPGLAEPGGTSFGVLIESDGPAIVVERATYTDSGGLVWSAGHASLGTPLP
jgi:Tol biopolymer transport system component